MASRLLSSVLAGIALCLSIPLTGQDFHYSQFYNAPLRISPALTGVFGGDIRLAGNYRSQWSSVPVPYKTFSVQADRNFITRTSNTGFWSGGLALNYDRAGDSKLSWGDVNLNASYTQMLTRRFFLSVGGTAGLGQRAFRLEDLRFDSQFDPNRGEYNPELGHGEAFGNTSNVFFDLGAGINLRFQALRSDALVDRRDKRSKLDLGVGVYHLNRPDMSFTEDLKVPLQTRISPYAMATLQLGKPLDLVGAFMAQFQNPYREMVAMGGLKLHLNRNLGRQYALQLGLAYRFDEIRDAVIPHIELEFNSWQAGFSYDINTSRIKVATNRKGGPEFSVRYIIRGIRPLPEFKICPLI